MSRIISIGTAVPSYQVKQDDILDFMQTAYRNEIASRKLNALFHGSNIQTRHSVVPDFGKNETANVVFREGESPDVEKRLTLFKNNAATLAMDAIGAAFRKLNSSPEALIVTHLITVTCTGLSAPGLDAELIEQLGLPNDIFHTSVNFSGCNAAFPAMKIADLITQTDKNAIVLVVCVELCTIHFQPKITNDHLLSNTIFGDGAAAMILVSDNYAGRYCQAGFSLKGFYSYLLADGKELMGWNITPAGFEMILNARLSALIGKEIAKVIALAGQKLGIAPVDADYWAVHPGGRKILDIVKTRLEIEREKISCSYQVLREYGNMSSPTVLFVLEEIMCSVSPGQTVLAIGFGPGINVETSLFVYEE